MFCVLDWWHIKTNRQYLVGWFLLLNSTNHIWCSLTRSLFYLQAKLYVHLCLLEFVKLDLVVNRRFYRFSAGGLDDVAEIKAQQPFWCLWLRINISALSYERCTVLFNWNSFAFITNFLQGCCHARKESAVPEKSGNS